MRRTREFTPFEAIVHTVVKRLGFCLSGVGKSIGFGTSAVTAALSSGATTSRSGACSATRRRIIATLFRYGATPEEREALCRTYLREHSDYGLLRTLCPDLEKGLVDIVIQHLKVHRVFESQSLQPPTVLFNRQGQKPRRRKPREKQ